ncbi:MAG TPA: hypothetical protein VF339_18320 [Gammaproteobacteria bacterium]
MSRWFLRYHFLRRDELERELFELCLRLRRSRPGPAALTGSGPARNGTHADAGRQAIRRCHVTRYDCADLDFPRLLEADAHVSALLRTLHETATLLQRFARAERRGGCSPS